MLLAVLLLGVFPTRSFFAQRDEIARERTKLAVLDRENAKLAERAARLQSDAEIERLAREQYSLVKPGEEAYAILPSADVDPPASGGDSGDGSNGGESAGREPDAGAGTAPHRTRSWFDRAVDLATFWN